MEYKNAKSHCLYFVSQKDWKLFISHTQNSQTIFNVFLDCSKCIQRASVMQCERKRNKYIFHKYLNANHAALLGFKFSWLLEQNWYSFFDEQNWKCLSVIVPYLFSLLASYRGIGSKSFPLTSKLACESCSQQEKENHFLIN